MTKESECPEYLCDFCNQNNHEACPIFEMIKKTGIAFCNCICNRRVTIDN